MKQLEAVRFLYEHGYLKKTKGNTWTLSKRFFKDVKPYMDKEVERAKSLAAGIMFIRKHHIGAKLYNPVVKIVMELLKGNKMQLSLVKPCPKQKTS